jgi:hypothetical protein
LFSRPARFRRDSPATDAVFNARIAAGAPSRKRTTAAVSFH